MASCTFFALVLGALFIAPVSQAGLVARYTLGGNLLDTSGNNNNGTFEGTGGAHATAAFIADARFGTVMDFDGTDDRVNLSSLFTMQNSSWSISLWIKTPANANRVPLIGKNNGDNSFSAGERVFEITGTGTWANIIDPEPAGNLAINGHSMGGVVTYQSAISLDDGTWHMATLVHDNSVSATDHTLYIDGVAQPKGSATMNNNSRADVGNLYIGFANASGTGAGGYFAGQMAQVYFYNGAISPSEVTALFATGDPFLLVSSAAVLASTSVPAGAVTRSVGIVNAGTSRTLNISGVSFSGPNAGLFSNPTFPTTLAPGASSNVTFTFTPTAVGTFTTTMTITSDSQGTPTANVNLQITVVPDPFLVAPASVALNDTSLPAGAVARSISITNTGPSQTLNISGVTFSGPNAALFTAPVFPVTVAPGTSGNIAFTFTPTTAGSFTATLEIASDSVGAPTTSVGLQIDVSTLLGGLVAYWSFDTDAGDLTGNHNGTLTNGAAISGGSLGFGGGEALSLSGGTGWAAAFMRAANPTNFNFNSDFTWHAYLKTAGSVGGIFSRSQVAGIWNQGSKALFLRNGLVQIDAGWVGNPNSNVSVSNNAWHQVIVTYVAATDRLNIFTDPAAGAVNGQYSQVFNLNGYNEHTVVHLGGTADTDFRIGFVGPDFETNGFVGLIDEAAVFEQALAGADLDRLITNGPSAFLPQAGQRRLALRADGTNLVFTWNSRAGKLYNILSTDNLVTNLSPWVPFQSNIVTTPTTNTLVVARPVAPQKFFVVEERPRPTAFSDNFETGMGGWSLGSEGAPGTAWELGTPRNVGPTAAHSPTNCFGSNIAGNYDIDANIWLRSPVIDLRAVPSATLEFWQFTSITTGGNDFGTVSVLDASDQSVLAVLAASVDGDSAGWVPFTRVLPAAALGKQIKIEFRFQSVGGGRAGWYIDDVKVFAP